VGVSGLISGGFFSSSGAAVLLAIGPVAAFADAVLADRLGVGYRQTDPAVGIPAYDIRILP